MPNGDSPSPAADAAKALASQLESRGLDYAIGGALALGFWTEPRGTLDVDLTLFLSAEKPASCLRLLSDLGCDLDAAEALKTLEEHSFCRVHFQATRVDVFLPMNRFYEAARARRRRVVLGAVPIMIWDAETLSVFKLMFFRRKDIADLEQILQTQGPTLDRAWIRSQVVEMYGERDARVKQWDELVAEIPG